MRKGFWIILVFAVWCVVSALWYMFSVKGLPDNTGLIKPATTSLAIAEIIIMVTIACMIGFWAAWAMRSEPLENALNELQELKFEVKQSESSINTYKEAADSWERRAQQAAEKAANAQLASDQLALRIADLTITEDQLKKKNRELESKAQTFESKTQALETKVNSLDGELNSTKFRLRVLEGEVADKNKAIGALTQELDDAGTQPKAEHRDWSDHPFVRPVEGSTEEKDDLTEIKGIGPAFQRKLNALDIFSWRQLSELDGESVERLAELIEVFPDRIHRDNWIGQATRLYNKKIGREV
jgi:predicted flap endonuclease-1-like 5' DNA nuclease